MAGTTLERSMRFLEAVSRGAGPDEMAAWFSPDVVQIEYPNPLFMTFRDGLIVEQHNYDCFDPW